MMPPRHRFATGGLIAIAIATAAPAQLALPVGSGTGTSTSSATGTATAQTGIAIPQTQTTSGYQPAVIASPTADPREETLPPAPARPNEPPKPGEFEAYVSDLVHKPMHRFGAELLLPDSRDFTAPATTAVPGDYVLNPGDQLLLNMAGSVQASALRLTIDGEGRIFIPRVGAVTLGGLRYRDAHDAIARQVTRQYRDFTVDVTVARLHGITVYVTGFAHRPGAYTVSGLSTLVNAVLAAGGPSAGGSFRSIQLRRGGKLVSDFDLYDLLLKGDKGGDAALQNGDVIHVTPVGTQVAVIGSVNQEAIFEVAPGETIADAIAYAGGASTIADTGRLLVLDSLGRTVGWQQLSAADAQTRVARGGDIVRVLSDIGLPRPVAQQPVLVTLSGEVAKPGRYYVAPGTRLADVVAQAGGLTPQAFPYASVITRESVRSQQRESFDRALNDMDTLLRTQPLVPVNRAQLAQPAVMTLIDSVMAKMRERVPNGRLVFDLPLTATSLPGDLIVENNDTIQVPTRPITIGVFGAVPSPASFAYRETMTIGDAVRLAGGVQKLGDKKGIFVVRANGTVVALGHRMMKERALPGDLVFVPVDASRGEFWARLRDITTSLFGGVAGFATVKALID